MPGPRSLLAALLTVALAADAAPGAAQEPVPSLSAFSFMAGCWRGPAGKGAVIEEYYTPPAENVMLGVTRYVREGRVTDYEFTRIERTDTAVIVTPYPKGQSPVPFRVTRIHPDAATWENPAHDFPRLIAYRMAGDDTLVARIEGPGKEGTRSLEWRMTRASCGG